MNQKSYLRKILQFVSQALTANTLKAAGLDSAALEAVNGAGAANVIASVAAQTRANTLYLIICSPRSMLTVAAQLHEP